MADNKHADAIIQWAHGAIIEYYDATSDKWIKCYKNQPRWSPNTQYRIAKKVKPYINWLVVSSDFKYLARDADGRVWLYKSLPSVDYRFNKWVGDDIYSSSLAEAFLSMQPGDCDWTESLVRRDQW